MWPYDAAEADWLVASAEASSETAANKKAAAATATVVEMTNIAPTIPAAVRTPANCNDPAARGNIFGRIVSRLRAWRIRATTRDTLYGLSDRELRDIGLSRDEIEMVTARHAPGHPRPRSPTHPVARLHRERGCHGQRAHGTDAWRDRLGQRRLIDALYGAVQGSGCGRVPLRALFLNQKRGEAAATAWGLAGVLVTTSPGA